MVDLAGLEVLDFDFNFCFHFLHFARASIDALIVKLADVNGGVGNVLADQPSDFVGLVHLLLDVFHLLASLLNLLVGLKLFLVLSLLILHTLLESLFLQLHLLADHFELDLLLFHLFLHLEL